jgi:hypothetical protein
MARGGRGWPLGVVVGLLALVGADRIYARDTDRVEHQHGHYGSLPGHDHRYDNGNDGYHRRVNRDDHRRYHRGEHYWSTPQWRLSPRLRTM